MSRRSSYKTTFKVQVIECADTHSNRGAARFFGVNERNVRLWQRSNYGELESKLIEWIIDCRAQSLAILGHISCDCYVLLNKNLGGEGLALVIPYIISIRNSWTILKCLSCLLSVGKYSSLFAIYLCYSR